MSGTMQKVYRDNSWWGQHADGSWVRWSDLDQAWVAESPPFASDAPTPPPPPPDAAPSPKAVDARVPEPDQVYTEYISRPLWRDVAHVYLWLFGVALLLIGNLALFFGPDLTSLFYGPPNLKEIFEGTYERPPSPYPMIGISLAVFGTGLVYLIRKASEEWWQIQLLVLGAAMGVLMTLVGRGLGWQSGFEPLRALYYMTTFGIAGFVYMYYRAWRGI